MMKKRSADKFWFPWWPDKWIFGSIRIECTPAERGIWVDLLSLASKDDGHIRANENTPYPLQQISGMLLIPEEELEAAIKKFLKKGKGNEPGKLTKLKSGTLYVTTWKEYQFTDRHKRRLESEMSAKTDTMSDHPDAILYNNKLNNNKLNNIKHKEAIYSQLLKVKGIGKEKAKKLTNFILEELAKEFPDIDLIEQVKKKCTWWRDHPITPKSRLHSQMSNWFKLGQKWIDEAKAQDRVGSSQQQRKPHPKEKELQCLLQEAEKKVRKENPDKRGEELETMIRNARGKTSQDFWKET